jgi:hypothetical protein
MQNLTSLNSGNRTSVAAVVGAMGIVFGDIATSPLYTLQGMPLGAAATLAAIPKSRFPCGPGSPEGLRYLSGWRSR